MLLYIYVIVPGFIKLQVTTARIGVLTVQDSDLQVVVKMEQLGLPPGFFIEKQRVAKLERNYAALIRFLDRISQSAKQDATKADQTDATEALVSYLDERESHLELRRESEL